MTTRTLIQEHKHVYLFKPADSFVTTHPQTLYVYLKPTSITEIAITSKISTTKINEYAINIEDYDDCYYDKYYPINTTSFPNTIKKTYQRVSFPYYFNSEVTAEGNMSRPMAILTFTYTYSYTCPSETETFIRKKIAESVSDANIILLLEKKEYLNTDIQNWIDAIKAGSSSILSEGSTTFDWPITSMVTPKWNNT